MTKQIKWVVEKWGNVETRYRVKNVLHEEKTRFQHMRLIDTYEFGKMLLLDDVVQTTEKDEFFYHEMMAHVPMLSHPDPKQVLIIGGGDGGVLREVLLYPGIIKVTLVEIDEKVVDFSRKHLPGISNGAFDNKKARLVFDDGARFIEKTKDKYDVVIVDSSDPVGPAQILFMENFYINVKKKLNKNGIMIRQTGSLQMQPDEQKDTYNELKNIFTHIAFYVFCVPTYIGGLFSSVFCSQSIDPKKIKFEELEAKTAAVGLKTRYYNPGIHIGAFHIPEYLKVLLK